MLDSFQADADFSTATFQQLMRSDQDNHINCPVNALGTTLEFIVPHTQGLLGWYRLSFGNDLHDLGTYSCIIQLRVSGSINDNEITSCENVHDSSFGKFAEIGMFRSYIKPGYREVKEAEIEILTVGARRD